MTPEEINRINANNKNKRPQKILKYCSSCKKNIIVSDYQSKCPVCHTFLGNTSQSTQSLSQSPQPNAPHCPTCNSTNVKKISSIRRGIHAISWGLLSTTARSQFECKNCGYKW